MSLHAGVKLMAESEPNEAGPYTYTPHDRQIEVSFGDVLVTSRFDGGNLARVVRVPPCGEMT